MNALAAAMTPHPYLVRRKRRETADTVTLELEPRAAALDAPFAPGQFNMLYRFGIGEVAISISGDPARRDLLIHTVRAVGATTSAIAGARPGDTVGVRGPFGRGWPMAEAAGDDIVVIAGGLGLAPLRPALYHLLGNRDQYGRVLLRYGARTPGDLLYRRELDEWSRKIDLGVTVDRSVNGWTGNVGVVTTLLARDEFQPDKTTALICGPEIMMRFAIRELERLGLPRDRIHVSLERNMKCAIQLCGHCQLGPAFVCQDGPVFRYDEIQPFLAIREY